MLAYICVLEQNNVQAIFPSIHVVYSSKQGIDFGWKHISQYDLICCLKSDLSLGIIQLCLCSQPAEFSRPVSTMCENHDGLSHRSVSEQPRLHSPSGDETELEPSLDQEEQDQEQGEEMEDDKVDDGVITPSKKKEFKVIYVWSLDCMAG